MKTATEVSWDVSQGDSKLTRKIVDRYTENWGSGKGYKPIHLSMDLTACHCNGAPLKLKELLAADDFNFVHDVAGISRHINRDNGQLEDCFSPRYSV